MTLTYVYVKIIKKNKILIKNWKKEINGTLTTEITIAAKVLTSHYGTGAVLITSLELSHVIIK